MIADQAFKQGNQGEIGYHIVGRADHGVGVLKNKGLDRAGRLKYASLESEQVASIRCATLGEDAQWLKATCLLDYALPLTDLFYDRLSFLDCSSSVHEYASESFT